MKKLFIRIAVGLVVLVILLLVIVFFSLNSIVKKGVETAGPKLTQVEVRLGAANLSPFSGSGRLSKLFVGNPAGYKTPSAITVGDVKVGVEVSSLLSDTLVVDEIHVQAPEITFEGGLSGNNLSKILDNVDAATGGDKAGKAETKKGEKKFFVKDVLVQGGKINATLTTPLGAKSLSVALPEVHMQNIGSREQGVTSAELVKQMLQPLLASAIKAVTENVAALGKDVQDIGKGAADQLLDKAKGVKDLFKKEK